MQIQMNPNVVTCVRTKQTMNDVVHNTITPTLAYLPVPGLPILRIFYFASFLQIFLSHFCKSHVSFA